MADALETRRSELEHAIQRYVREAREGGLVLDWVLTVEHDDGEGRRSLLVFPGPTMTAWKALGFATWIHRRLVALAEAVFSAGG